MLQKERFQQPEKQPTVTFVLVQLQRNVLTPVLRAECAGKSLAEQS